MSLHSFLLSLVQNTNIKQVKVTLNEGDRFVNQWEDIQIKKPVLLPQCTTSPTEQGSCNTMRQCDEQALSNQPPSARAVQQLVKPWLKAQASSVSLLLFCLLFQKMPDCQFQAPNLHHPSQKQRTLSEELLPINCIHNGYFFYPDGIPVENRIKSL